MKKKGYLAFDFGASSGRLMLGVLKDEKLILEEIHRFANEPVYAGGRMYWDFLRLFHEMKIGLKKVAKKEEVVIQSIGIDTWGVDGVWLDGEGNLINNPIHYRDSRTKKVIEEVDGKIDENNLYSITGIQKMLFNTIYQIYYDKNKVEIIKDKGYKWLFMPDLFGYMLTGKLYNEYTIASTSGMLEAGRGEYEPNILKMIGISEDCLPQIVRPGWVVGTMLKEIEEETGLKDVKVVAVASHDTASAIVGTPLQRDNEVYLVCGTWCLMGMERSVPCLTPAAKSYGLTNEGGAGGTIRLLKNINGLWFLQQLKKAWCDEGLNITFMDIIEAVEKNEHTYAINTADERFLAPINMKNEIIAYCQETYGVTLSTVGEIAKAAYNGLCKLYKETIDTLEVLSGETISTIRMVGGGIQDHYLCRKVAEVTRKKVIAGPIEASALGNIVMQMQATGDINSIEEGRLLIAKSFDQITYGNLK